MNVFKIIYIIAVSVVGVVANDSVDAGAAERLLIYNGQPTQRLNCCNKTSHSKLTRNRNL